MAAKTKMVKLHRPGWTNHTWSPHGLPFPIRFDGNDNAEVDEDPYNEWIGDDTARIMGITVTKPKKPAAKPAAKKATKPKAAAKKPAAKK